ncbi:MAG: hybrid sensor histidine kinase/response regulator [Synechococcus lacustris]|jgi:two-component system sensor histidine kinase and response regulator WspE
MSEPLPEATPLELFRLELEERIGGLNSSLLILEAAPSSQEAFDQFMRSVHSVKGAASIVVLQPLVRVAHALEDYFVGVKSGKFILDSNAVSQAFRCIDLFQDISRLPSDQIREWLSARSPELDQLLQCLEDLMPSDGSTPSSPQPLSSATDPSYLRSAEEVLAMPGANERVVRVEADNLNRIMALSGEMLVEAKWLQPFADSLNLLKDRQKDLQVTIESLRLQLSEAGQSSSLELVERARQKEKECRDTLSERLGELELYALRTTNLSYRLYREVIGSNMRPFSDAIVAFPRMVRDLASGLGKQVHLEVVGKGTLVDRDILRKLESPLTHILRNAIDHGIELPALRADQGKSSGGTIRMEALHRGGMLSITIADDGAGVPYDEVRRKLVDAGLFNFDEAQALSEVELCEQLFQPGFSTAKSVSELSGRGVGLDAVSAMANDVGGTVRFSSVPSEGTSIHFQLPLTLSVVRTLLVEIAGEPYAFPLARLDQILSIEVSDISVMEGRECFNLDGVSIGLIWARQVMNFPEANNPSSSIPVVVISDHAKVYGVVVDRYLGEQDLVVRPLDPRLGKVANVSAAALMGDGQPILIVDTVDLVRSIDALLQSSELQSHATIKQLVEGKRILVVDDSPVALELQARLVLSRGYRVDKAVDGAEAWRLLRENCFDLIVTDVEMPEMDGITLVKTMRLDPKFAQLPIIISSSRGSDSDRLQGLEAGADYYLVKSSFQDDALLDAIHQLIGAA